MKDLSKIKSGNRVVIITDPEDGSPTGLEWELIALDSDEAKAVTRRITDKRNKLAARGKVFNAEEIDQNETDLIVAVSKGWTWKGEASWNGEKPAFNLKNVREVSAQPFIRKQLTEALDDESSFFRNASR